MAIPLTPIQRIRTLSHTPSRVDGAFGRWILQEDTPRFLNDNADSEEMIIRLSADSAFLQTVIVPASDIAKADPLELREWDFMHDKWGLNYKWGEKGDVWLEAPFRDNPVEAYRNADPLTFHRSFEGHDKGKSYFEVLQKLTHVFDVHYVPHLKAWCRLDDAGDIEPIIKIYDLPKGEAGYGGHIITMKRKVLDAFLVAGRYRAVCAFDFTRTDNSFSGWGSGREESDFNNGKLVYRLTVEPSVGSYLRGVQIIAPTETVAELRNRLQHGDQPKEYASFIAHDTKNGVVKEISCAPGATANYFTKSDLPYEITPAFFRPEVLQKYKADTEKYRFDERRIYCRGAWSLKTYDINEAGQVHTYLVYLRDLPYSEQLYWKSFNEKPKGGLSERAFTTDIKGDFYTEYNSLQSVLRFLRSLDGRAKWWSLKDQALLENVHYPATSAAEEWAEAILRLDQLVVEGLDSKWLRRTLDDFDTPAAAQEGSLVLLAKCLVAAGFDEEQSKSVVAPLKELHHLRSKVKGHAKGTDAEALRTKALQDHGSYRKHFESLCEGCDISLKRVAKGLTTLDGGAPLSE